MRDKSSPEVIAHLEAENAYTLSVMAPTEELQKKLYAEMLSHIKETDVSVPYRNRGWFYYVRTIEGSQYPIHCRRLATGTTYDESQPEAVLLDVNQLAEGQAFMSVGDMTVSPDGNLLAYSTDNTGFRQYTLHLRDLRTGVDLPDTAERVGAVAWAATRRPCFIRRRTKSRSGTIISFGIGLGMLSKRMLWSKKRETNASTLPWGDSRWQVSADGGG